MQSKLANQSLLPPASTSRVRNRSDLQLLPDCKHTLFTDLSAVTHTGEKSAPPHTDTDMFGSINHA